MLAVAADQSQGVPQVYELCIHFCDGSRFLVHSRFRFCYSACQYTGPLENWLMSIQMM